MTTNTHLDSDQDERSSTELLRDLTSGERIVMHVDANDGRLRGRPLTVAERDDDGTYFFLARRDADAAFEGEVLLSFTDDKDGNWVSASGVQRVVTDRSIVERIWSPMAKAWFDGPDDPELVALEVSVSEFAWWESPSSRVVRTAKLIKGAITGDVDEGGHGRRTV